MERLLQVAQPLLAPAFVLWGSPVSWAEVVAFVLSLAMVGCNIRVWTAGWPLAIAASLLYALVFEASRLYGEATLQLFFVVVALWGWWQWLRGRAADGQALQVRRLSARGRLGVLVALLCLWPLFGLLLRRYTDTDVPWWDALPTAGSVLGQWLLGRKYIENWPMWLAVNLVSITLFAYKGLWLTVLLYALFALLSVAGWRAWLQRAATHG
ncbi:MAG: nicotinamide mononucleotide transporter [Burkholderiales bacterium]|nr:nicotinamide mononucleotide transporter [Burkholderiales bacterium]